MDNFLLQIRGKKLVTMFPPEALPYLYVSGSSSAVTDIDSPDFKVFPKFELANRMRIELLLEEGEVLFIPALWFHNV